MSTSIEKAPCERMRELVEIRKALRTMGLFQLPEFAEKAKRAMNSFAHVGGDGAFKWKLDNGDRIVVTLRGRSGRESGVTVETSKYTTANQK